MQQTDSLTARWRQGHTLVNGWLTIPSSWTAELLAHAGFDTLTIDAQHGLATDLTAILPILQAIATTGTLPLVRVPWNDPATHMRMLDAGAQGIICPMLNSRADTEAFVQACRYPPHGCRSFGPMRAGLRTQNYFHTANEEVVTLAMIETELGFKNLDDLAQTPGLTGLYVGPWDLCLSLGLERIADFSDPVLLNILKHILAVAEKNKLVAGIHCDSPETAITMRSMGFRFVTPLTDTFMLQKAAYEGLRSFREE
ncbi:MAG: 2,4-dihydroxyhept-2-ene-1,7-dioic acid aldolase [Bacteroidetes bacterium]|nr:2,4-dihydroxyhept-2-ene-1,7-dioic acid aldolase [Bacteroidota bacterium]